ncbi:hypothetical protein [Paenibacillus oceani]|uniref:Neutral/alkaline non-lysosomal ceramidase N-terminal domain-containing protein n=1 Tax=Paenibacillus oceani TaxID=2772510 RepID=A0A927CDJ0_9BACL|nr:hypothetical protein [Paenibacillus oceani]MBD2864698.1 hypothetical protein [Paenibacillus oceani]
MNPSKSDREHVTLKHGWAQTDITPLQPVFIAGQFHARLSEGVMDPLTATVWAVQTGEEHVVFASCDLIAIPDDMRDAVRRLLELRRPAGLNPRNVILNATHTHTGPEVRVPSPSPDGHASSEVAGMPILEAMPVQAYLDFAVERIADAVCEAWSNLQPGAVAYGWGNSVISHNRRWVNDSGQATMYDLPLSPTSRFRHMEGSEDHSLNVIAAYGPEGDLRGLVVNVPCPSQKSEHLFVISADWWHETRQLLRQKYGPGLFILPQCSAAGDLSPHPMLDREPYERMLRLKNRTAREEIASRLVSAIDDIVPYIHDTRRSDMAVKLRSLQLELPVNRLTERDAQHAEQEANRWMDVLGDERRKLEERPELRTKERWYVAASKAYRIAEWHINVLRRYERQKRSLTLSAEINVVQLGEVALVTVPYELYMDFGSQMKVRSKAKQTIIVQLAGAGTYLPSPRSLAGGGYGSVPASNPIGSEGGQAIADLVTEQLVRLMGD